MFKVLIQLRSYFKENIMQYTIAISALITASIITLIPPKILGEAIDHIYGIDGKVLTREKLIFYAISMLLTIIVGYIVRFIWRSFLNGAGFKLEYEYRNKIFDKLLQMNAEFYEKNLAGDLMAKATVDLNQLQSSASRGILMLMEATFYLLSIVVVMSTTINFHLTLLAILPFPIVVFASRVIGKKLHSLSRKEQDVFGELNDLTLESIKNVRVIRAYNQEENNIEYLSQKEEAVDDIALKVLKTQALFTISFRIVFATAYGIAIAYGSQLILKGTMSQGDLVAFMTYLGMLGWPMMAIGQMVNILQRGSASFERIDEVLKVKPDLESGSKKVGEFDELSFNNYTFTYPTSDSENLKDVTFTLKNGQTIGIVGKTGGGKTTILKQLLRIFPYGEGQILINKESITEYSISQVRELFGYVPQEHLLFSESVLNNLTMNNNLYTKEEIDAAIDAADFRKDIAFLKDGLSTIVGESGVMLSGGQKQRLQIVRALLKKPEILVLDDSLSAVDGKTEAKIIENLSISRKGKTNIIVAHRLSAVVNADQILVLHNGRIIDVGTHNELIEKDGWYAEQYRIQQMEE